MKSDYVKVEEGLVRDTSSCAILNTNEAAYQAYKASRMAKRTEHETQTKLANMQSQVDRLTSDIGDIKQMLAALLTRE